MYYRKLSNRRVCATIILKIFPDTYYGWNMAGLIVCQITDNTQIVNHVFVYFIYTQ